MDHQTDPAFFTDEEIAKFAKQLSEEGIRIYVGRQSSSSISSVHPTLKHLISDELDLKDATSASIVPMASDLAEVREEQASRELQSFQVSLPYYHDENRYHQTFMNVDDDQKEQAGEVGEEASIGDDRNKHSEANEREGMCKSICNQDTEKEVHMNTNEHIIGNSERVDCNEVASEDDERGKVMEKKMDYQSKEQNTPKTSRKRSSYKEINAGIVAQREKIRDICNNRQKGSKKTIVACSDSGCKNDNQKLGEELSEEDQKSCKNHADHPKVDDKCQTDSSSSDGCFDTEDEQSDDLIEFESQAEPPIARKRKSNSLLAASEAIGSCIAKASTQVGGQSEWIKRNVKKRNKLKKTTKRVSLDTSLSNKPSAIKQDSTTTQYRNNVRRRTIGFGAAPTAVNKRKTQLSLLHMLKK